MLHFSLKEKLIPCKPAAWARSGHAQTLLGHFLPSPILNTNDERIELLVSGGDTIVAHFIPGTSNTIVYAFHGLGGSSHRSYMQRTALIAQSFGHSVFLFNHRGCGTGSGLAREPYHSGRAEDLSALIEYGRKRFPSHIHVAIGYSLSANALLLLAAGQRGSFLPDAAIAVNAPIDLHKAGVLLKTGFNLVYDQSFMRDMRREISSRLHQKPELNKLRVPAFSNMMDFDELYTAPHGGFKNRDHYYSTCSAKQYLQQIKIPTVLLTAKSDPFVDYRDYQDAKLSPHVHRHIEDHGGHMGYLSNRNTPLGTKRWLDYALHSYLTSLKS